jgi:hypothetical protein
VYKHLSALKTSLIAAVDKAFPGEMDRVLKLHVLRHSVTSIRYHGTLLSTEALEHTHIRVKEIFREATNKQAKTTALQIMYKVPFPLSFPLASPKTCF